MPTRRAQRSRFWEWLTVLGILQVTSGEPDARARQNDDLIQGQLGFIKNYYEIPTCTLEFDVMHDLVNGRYNIDNLKLEFGPANLDDANVKLNRFGPGALKRAVGR